MSFNNIITVVRDPNQTLGKRFDLKPDGTISKHSAVHLSLGIALQHEIATHEDFVALLTSVSTDPHAAIINASFDGIEIGEEFIILSEREIARRLDIPASDRSLQKGVHPIQYDGQNLKAVGRFKENVRPSSWQLLDRDIDQHTPDKYRSLSTTEWIKALDAILPGLGIVSYVETQSTSSRVMRGGIAIGNGNSHIWFRVNNATDVERLRTAIIIRAAQLQMTWTKPRHSKNEEGKVVGQSLTTIVDPSVLTPGRLVFDGQPIVREGLTINPLSAVIHSGETDSLDTSAITIPDARTTREVTRRAGVEMSFTSDGNALKTTTNDLSLDMEIETQNHGTLTVRQIIERGLNGKVRCQTPFRASDSWAAFLGTTSEGFPFVYDVGTNTTHWLDKPEVDEVILIPATAVVKDLLPVVKEDSAAALEPHAVNALATIKQHKPPEYQRIRNALKQANAKVSVTAIDRSVKAHISETSTAPTHHGYAKNVLQKFTVGPHQPVGYQGELFVVDADSLLWVNKPVTELSRVVAELHDGEENCSRASDYRAIAEHAISLANNDIFFAEAPTGLACPKGFYQVSGEEISLVPLNPEHRQRLILEFTPLDEPMPLFEKFLHQTFRTDLEGEENEQRRLIQELAGGIMLGIVHKFQVAVLFYDPFGRAGKGTLENILRRLVPKQHVSAISPFKWAQDYHVASLAGKRLNVVGELPENEPLPAAAFKSVIGGDLVTGRHPTHRPITFSNEAAHLFMSNHLITTKDQSEAFFARWKIVEFPNSLLRSGLPIDKDLARRIIENEMPGIAYWALEGAARLLRNNKFSDSSAHDRLMTKWRRCTNTLEEFISEACELFVDGTYRRSTFYSDYKDWCSENGRKPFSKGRVKELLEHNIGFGIRLVELDGYETFRGITKNKKTSC